MELDDSGAMMRASVNIYSALRLFFSLFMVSWASFAHADLRVLIKFDASEHRIYRMVEVESINPALVSSESSQHALPRPGMVSVIWKALDGRVLHSSNISDPRLTHAPLSGSESSPAMIGLTDGAYMVSGPSDSAFMEVRLPENTMLALDAQTWQFELNP